MTLKDLSPLPSSSLQKIVCSSRLLAFYACHARPRTFVVTDVLATANRPLSLFTGETVEHVCTEANWNLPPMIADVINFIPLDKRQMFAKKYDLIM